MSDSTHNTLILSSDGVFHSIQGEGNTIGYPATFIRLQGCNLRCSWCDTSYALDRADGETAPEIREINISELHQMIRAEQRAKGITENEHIFRIVFTGGEPLLQQEAIVQFLKSNPEYIHCEIETNGTILPDKWLLRQSATGRVKFNCSPKLSNSGLPRRARIKDTILKTLSGTPNVIFKLVCATETDVKEAMKDIVPIVGREKVTIMPEGMTREDNADCYKRIMPSILKYGLMTHPRLQNIAFDGRTRRV